MDLIIGNRVIDTDIDTILDTINKESKRHLFRDRIQRGDNLNITCPFHKGGEEQHPSCNIYTDKHSKTIPYGFYRCFTCGASGNLWHMVAEIFSADDSFGKQWLVDRFGDYLEDREIEIPDINLEPTRSQIINDDVITGLEPRHPYMYQRGLTDEVIDRFQIRYDKEDDTIVFPVWDEHGRLVMLSKRSVSGKTFKLEKAVSKPVYLLYDVIANNITKVCICESQIDALKLWGWGYPAVALFGTGSKQQYDILKKSGIRHYILCFDGDSAGEHGANAFVKNIKSNAFISQVLMPMGKDIGDLTKEEFEGLSVIDR